MNRVKIFDGAGNLKEVISEDQLSRDFWAKEGHDPGGMRGKSFKVEIIKCHACGKEFKKTLSNQKYCPKVRGVTPCSVVAYKEKLRVPKSKKVCKKCGKVFEGTKNRVFCGDPCRHVKVSGEVAWAGTPKETDA